MKKVLIIILLASFFILFSNISFASDVNETDMSSISDNVKLSVDLADNNKLSASDMSLLSASKANNNPTNIVKKTIKSKDVTKYYSGDEKFKATFLKKDGSPLANYKVKINVDGEKFNQKTNKKGVVLLDIDKKPGKYKIISTNPLTGFTKVNYIKILSTIKADDLSIKIGSHKKFKATFYKNNGKKLSKNYIFFKFKGKKYYARTNKAGVASFSLKYYKAGNYKIISINKDGLRQINKINIKKEPTHFKTHDYIFLNNDKKVIRVELRDKSDLEYKKIKFIVNGKKYSSWTNKKGVASLKLPKLKNGIHTINYKFSGDKYYKSTEASSKLTIIPSKKAKFTVKSTKVFGQGANLPFKVKLTSGKIPISKKHVIFKIAGKTYKKRTNNDGIASIPINLKIGNYNIYYSIKKDSTLNALSKSSKITVKPRIPTIINWQSDINVYRGPQVFNILLTDLNNQPLSNKDIRLSVNSHVYHATTQPNGIATFKFILPAGNHAISFSFNGDNNYEISGSSVNVISSYKVNSGSGYWIKTEQFDHVSKNNLELLASKGTKDIFLHYDAVTTFGQSRVESWINDANNLGMRVHMWVPIFKNGNTWSYPLINGELNTYFFNQKISEISMCCHVKGVSGIHFDYIRYPGNAYKFDGSSDAINEFIRQATGTIRSLNNNIIISGAIAASYDNLIYKYGQDFTFISQYMDVVIPMIYKGNYNKDTSWISTTTKWFVDNSKGAKIWTGIQTYRSDDDLTILSEAELFNDARSAVSAGAAGLVLFRWGLTNFIDFNALI